MRVTKIIYEADLSNFLQHVTDMHQLINFTSLKYIPVEHQQEHTVQS